MGKRMEGIVVSACAVWMPSKSKDLRRTRARYPCIPPPLWSFRCASPPEQQAAHGGRQRQKGRAVGRGDGDERALPAHAALLRAGRAAGVQFIVVHHNNVELQRVAEHHQPGAVPASTALPGVAQPLLPGPFGDTHTHTRGGAMAGDLIAPAAADKANSGGQPSCTAAAPLTCGKTAGLAACRARVAGL